MSYQRIIGKKKLLYVYYFGDGWLHDVVLEKISPLDPAETLPLCLDGAMACPPEDCGGIGGYEMLLEAIVEPENPDHEQMTERIGGDFDSKYFDLENVNKLLRENFNN